jgi:hypothetical protein
MYKIQYKKKSCKGIIWRSKHFNLTFYETFDIANLAGTYDSFLSIQ